MYCDALIAPGAIGGLARCLAGIRTMGVQQMQRFDDRAVVVTGAGSGIGAATVRRLFEEGASVVVVDWREDAVASVVAEFAGSDRVHGIR